MVLKFQTNKQILSRTDSNEAVELTQNYLEAEFTTDTDWNGLNLTALFQKGNTIKEVILSNNSCMVPVEVIKSGGFAVSLLGISDSKVLTSSKVIVYVDKTIDSSEATSPAEATASLYSQILTRLNNMVGNIEPEDLESAISDYFTDHPISNGEDGFSPTISVSEISGGYSIVVTDADGTTTFSLMNGTNGTNGNDGYTPVRGTDYWTNSDKTEIINAVLEALPSAESGEF